MKVLVIQDGYEHVVANRCGVKADLTVDIFRNRTSYFFYIVSLIKLMAYATYCKLLGRKIEIYYSSNEADEYLYYLWSMLTILSPKVEYIRFKINERESSFIKDGAVPSLPLRLKVFKKLVGGKLGCGLIAIVNDLGAKSYALELRAREVKPVFESRINAGSPTRVIILSEPYRSEALLPLEHWKEEMTNAIDVIVEDIELVQLFTKSHPFQDSLCYENEEVDCIDLPRDINIFEFLRKDDAVLGTFGSVIDIAPSICPTYSIIKKLDTKDDAVVARVERSGAVIL